MGKEATAECFSEAARRVKWPRTKRHKRGKERGGEIESRNPNQKIRKNKAGRSRSNPANQQQPREQLGRIRFSF